MEITGNILAGILFLIGCWQLYGTIALTMNVNERLQNAEPSNIDYNKLNTTTTRIQATAWVAIACFLGAITINTLL